MREISVIRVCFCSLPPIQVTSIILTLKRVSAHFTAAVNLRLDYYLICNILPVWTNRSSYRSLHLVTCRTQWTIADRGMRRPVPTQAVGTLSVYLSVVHAVTDKRYARFPWNSEVNVLCKYINYTNQCGFFVELPYEDGGFYFRKVNSLLISNVYLLSTVGHVKFIFDWGQKGLFDWGQKGL